MTWGFKEWLTTVVLGGKVWKDLEEKGLVDKYNLKKSKQFKNLTTSSSSSSSSSGDDGFGSSSKDEAVPELDEQLRKALGIAERDEEFFQMSVQFIETLTMDIEGITRAPARHKLWAWVVKALAGPKAPFGPYHYLVVDQYLLRFTWRWPVWWIPLQFYRTLTIWRRCFTSPTDKDKIFLLILAILTRLSNVYMT